MKETWDEPPPFVLTSSARNYGKEDLLRYMSEMVYTFRDSSGALSVGESDAMDDADTGFSLDDGNDDGNGTHAGGERAPDTKTALPWIQRTLTAERKKKKKKEVTATTTTAAQRSKKKGSTTASRTRKSKKR